jgi:hypothetical protein
LDVDVYESLIDKLAVLRAFDERQVSPRGLSATAPVAAVINVHL